MRKKHITINRDKDIITISKDENFEHLLGVSYVFYERIMSLIESEKGPVFQISPRFKKLIDKLSVKSDSVKLSEEELGLFVDWVDTLCLIMLDIDTIDYKNIEIKRYLTLSEKFIKKSKEIMQSTSDKEK